MTYESNFEKIILVIEEMDLGNLLKNLREEKNLTQSDLAKRLNISRVQYCQYENDYFNIPIKYLIIIADYYNISVDYLLGISHNKKVKKYQTSNCLLSGKRLKEFRKSKKITQKKLAELLNTTHSNIGFYERGRNFIATPFLYTICKKYNVSADYLLGRTDSSSI